MGSTDNFLPGTAVMDVDVVFCSAAVPDFEVTAVTAETEDAPYKSES
jgi:hypothetical protein